MSEEMDKQSEQLASHCDAIKQGAGLGIDWVKDVRVSSSRVDREADALIQKLRRVRNFSSRLGQASQSPVSVGFFGISQAGKSYLISTMAAGKNGRLETVYDGRRLDFMQHVNPPGGGKEATGLVTRFTRKSEATPTGFPIQLAIFSEIDLVKILGNSFFNDFNREKVIFNTDAEYINQLLADLSGNRKQQPTGGVTEDDMVDLMDYFESRFQKSMEPLMGSYWPVAIDLAPYLSANDRGRLFSILWGEIDELTATYLLLRNALETLSFAKNLYAPLDVLVKNKEQGDGFSQMDSIMNVDILGRLGHDDIDRIELKPIEDGQTLDSVTIPRSILAVLTLELIFPLTEQPECTMLETVDLLDFPGYRARLNVDNLTEVKEAVKDNQTDPVAELILRGKVAYLFERYTDFQEMNVLIVCTASETQSDVTDVGPVLTNWIETTQGETAEIRGTKKPGLIWAITKFDKKISQSLSYTDDMLKMTWGMGGMMQLTLLERFGQYNWVSEWATGTPFDNIFLVRKPCEPVSFLDLKSNLGKESEKQFNGMFAVSNSISIAPLEDRAALEKGIKSEYKQQLVLMKQTFCDDETVNKHFSDPATAWDSMMSLNQGGVGLLSRQVERAADIQIKLERISEQIEATVDDLVNKRFANYFQAEGAGEVDKKLAIAKEILDSLKARAPLIGELIFQMQPVTEHFRSIYLRTETDSEKTAASKPEEAEQKVSTAVQIDNSMFDLNLDFRSDVSVAETAISQQPETVPHTSTTRFIRGVLQEWIKHMRELPERTDLMNFLGFAKPSVDALIDELISAMDRLELEQRLTDAINKTELQTSATRSRLVDRQVLVVSSIINEFLSTLGFAWQPVAKRVVSKIQVGQKVFAPAPAIPAGKLPAITEQATRYTEIFLMDWSIALEKLIVENAGHSAGRDITPEQNEALGKLMKIISGK